VDVVGYYGRKGETLYLIAQVEGKKLFQNGVLTILTLL
jgi:hypothetical protein